eukprot:965573-Pelagomonas_calceolata.AAC.6
MDAVMSCTLYHLRGRGAANEAGRDGCATLKAGPQAWEHALWKSCQVGHDAKSSLFWMMPAGTILQLPAKATTQDKSI